MQEILKKLAVIQSDLKAPKGQKNTYGGYYYRSCEDIFEAVKPLLKNNSCVLTACDEILQVSDRIYVRATVTIHDIDTGESISNVAYAREANTKKGMDESQITGTASSYARKYALNGLFCIDDTKDPDTNEYHEKVNSKKLICPKCGKAVEPFVKSDGEVVSAQDVFNGCGGICYDCYQKS